MVYCRLCWYLIWLNNNESNCLVCLFSVPFFCLFGERKVCSADLLQDLCKRGLEPSIKVPHWQYNLLKGNQIKIWTEQTHKLVDQIQHIFGMWRTVLHKILPKLVLDLLQIVVSAPCSCLAGRQFIFNKPILIVQQRANKPPNMQTRIQCNMQEKHHLVKRNIPEIPGCATAYRCILQFKPACYATLCAVADRLH